MPKQSTGEKLDKQNDKLKDEQKQAVEAKRAESTAEAKESREAEAKSRKDGSAEEATPLKKAVAYYKNKQYSALYILVRDKTGKKTVEQARFTPYFDTWKGDVVRVGYLATDSKAVASRCELDDTCESIDKKEYEEAVSTLQQAPVRAA